MGQAVGSCAGSIPEIEQSSDKIYNTATVYDPEGEAQVEAVQKSPLIRRQPRGQAPQSALVRHRYSRPSDFQGGSRV